jgi:mRNA interferase HigB
MKVHLISKQTVEEYMLENARSRPSLGNWVSIIRFADWNAPNDMIMTLNSADILGNGSNRIVFNIGGNTYRIICKYCFGATRVHLYVKWIGTHAEYSKLCKEGKQFDVSLF